MVIATAQILNIDNLIYEFNCICCGRFFYGSLNNLYEHMKEHHSISFLNQQWKIFPIGFQDMQYEIVFTAYF